MRSCCAHTSLLTVRRSLRVRCDANEVSRPSRRSLGVVLTGVAAGTAAFQLSTRGYPLPLAPAGGFSVSGSDVRLPCGSSSFRARVLWPCADDRAGPELPYMGSGDDGQAQADSLASLVRLPSILTAHLARARSGIRDGAPPLPGPWPVLCYSHGYGGNSQMGTLVLREIASYGCVVVAVEHTDGSASRTVRADGSVQRFGERPEGGRATGLALRAAELNAAADAVRSSSSALPPGIASVCNLQRLFIGGHSYGAPTALLALRSAQAGTIKGALLHDPALVMMAEQQAVAPPCPVLALLSDEYTASAEYLRPPAVALLQAAPEGSALYHLVGSAHGNYVDAPFWAARLVMRTLARLGIPASGAGDQVATLRAIGTTAAAFLGGADVGAAAFAAGEPLLEPLVVQPRKAARQSL
jgi:dienelactone hydrolase